MGSTPLEMVDAPGCCVVCLISALSHPHSVNVSDRVGLGVSEEKRCNYGTRILGKSRNLGRSYENAKGGSGGNSLGAWRKL
jgi:hypothetical protein